MTCISPSQSSTGPQQVTISLDGGTTWTTDPVYYTYSPPCPTCQNQGVCNLGTCQCTAEWTGPQCTIPNCASLSNCNGNGNCSAGPTCNCFSGYTGTTCSQCYPKK